LPAAEAIVNPNQPGDGFPSKHLAGVGVDVLRADGACGRDCAKVGWFAGARLEPNRIWRSILDLVAFGTVADVVRLDHHNRILVEQGIAPDSPGSAASPGIARLVRGRRSGSQDRLSASRYRFLSGSPAQCRRTAWKT
jgi:single-stranded-DNA-specific exonuclease